MSGGAADAEGTVLEAARRTPVRDEVDVLVCGGGLGGVAAAVSAARAGARTLLVERNAFLGGTATAGLCCSVFNCLYTGRGEPGTTGIAVEVVDALAAAEGYGPRWRAFRWRPSRAARRSARRSWWTPPATPTWRRRRGRR